MVPQTVTPPRFTDHPSTTPPSTKPLSATGAVLLSCLFCNRDDHFVRTLVAARCSALYFLTNFVSSVALGNYSIF
jgi:hypothetical protein